MYYPKTYSDENYPDPVPVGHCIICGEAILPGDEHYKADEGLICGRGVVGKVMAEVVGPVKISCLLAYMAEMCTEDEAAAALGVEKVARV